MTALLDGAATRAAALGSDAALIGTAAAAMVRLAVTDRSGASGSPIALRLKRAALADALRGVLGAAESESNGAGATFSTAETGLAAVSARAFGSALLAAPDEAADFEVAFGLVERVDAVGRDLGPAVLWLDVAESLTVFSAWATAVEVASDAQKPTVTAPAPSHVEISLGCLTARWRPTVDCPRRETRLAARCLAATVSS